MHYVLQEPSPDVRQAVLQIASIHHRTRAQVLGGKPMIRRTRDQIQSALRELPVKLVFKPVEDEQGLRTAKIVSKTFERLKAKDLYFGEEDNERRNAAKIEALAAATGHVFLLAQSGTCYFAHGGRLSQHVKDFLDRSDANRFTATLLHPFCDAAIKLYLTYVRAAKLTDYRTPVKTTAHLGKLRETLIAYCTELRDVVAADSTSKVSLTFTSFDPCCSALVTPDRCFVEPYYLFNPIERKARGLDTYEWELICDGAASLAHRFRVGPEDAKAIPSHVHFYKVHCLSVPKFLKNLSSYRAHCEQRLTLMQDSGELNRDEYDAILPQLKRLEKMLRETLK